MKGIVNHICVIALKELLLAKEGFITISFLCVITFFQEEAVWERRRS